MPVDIQGEFIQAGAKAPEFSLVKGDLSRFTLADGKGKNLILNIFPSMDTAVCATSVRKFNTLNESVKSAETRLAEILTIKKHILNYRKTRDTYVAYRQSGYSRDFFEEHRMEITLHKAAKAAFDQLNVEKLPTIRELNEEYDRVLRGKKKDYAEYRTARKEMQEYLRARQNVELFYKEETERVLVEKHI